MKRLRLLTLFLLSLASLISLSSTSTNESFKKIHIRQKSLSNDAVKIWIFFKDKGSGSIPLSKQIIINEHAKSRRLVRGTVANYDDFDRAVSPAYIDQIRPLARKLGHQSRWLNAVSAEVQPNRLEEIADLEIVKEIREVAMYRREKVSLDIQVEFEPQKQLVETALPYGQSFGQLAQIQVPQLHDLGLTGAGVKILLLDTGFKLDHPAFSHLNIDSTYDFINNDADVQDDDSLLIQQTHGTSTLSLIGGYRADTLIGVAFEATFLCAKTERYVEEIQIEEDAWVAAVEWGEGLGADVVSSSLGYTDWYTYADFDGNTAVTTVAADIAAAHGLIVVNSVGNALHGGPLPSLIAPSDGDSVIAVGAVNFNGEITGFSSDGPSADGRIKPDLCAQGGADWVATSGGSYGYGSGTSFSCPLVAGVVALLLQAHPEWSYGQIYHALTATATQSSTPNNILGYGIVQAAEALGLEPETPARVVTVFPNPFSTTVSFLFNARSTGDFSIMIYTIAGEQVEELTGRANIAGSITQLWDGTNEDGEEVADGVFIAFISAPGISETVKFLHVKNGGN